MTILERRERKRERESLKKRNAKGKEGISGRERVEDGMKKSVECLIGAW